MNFAMGYADMFRELARLEPLRSSEELMRDLGLLQSLRAMPIRPLIELNLAEQAHAYLVTVQLPGMTMDNIELDVSARRVSISVATGRGSVATREQTEAICYVENMFRTVALEREVDASRMVSSFQDGVLALTLPMHEAMAV